MTERTDELVFGTDGWRDVVAERFTFENVGRAAQAYARQLLAAGGRRVLVGHDTRFLGARFARRAAEVLAANGLEVALSADYLPTPALSFAVKRYGADGGVMLTASHNPAEYNGFKLKGSYGGSASDATYRGVAELVARVRPADVASFDPRRHAVERFDVRRDYYDALAGLVDVGLLARAGGPLLHDAMGGAAAGWLTGFFRHVGLPDAAVELRGEPDPMFHGVHPEPIARNLEATMDRMTEVESPPLFAVATDGDGDRLGVVLPGGAFFGSHQIFAVLLDRLERSGRRGTVVKTFTVSRIVERLAAGRGLPVVETKVGFKYVADEMLRGDVLIGGEESGGIGVQGHLPERDGIANALLLLEAVAAEGVGLGERFAELERETGWRHAYDRLDLRLADPAQQARALAAFDDPGAVYAGRPVTSVERRDGVKLNLADDAWLLVRPSGTEPLLRVYCEAPDEGAVAAALAAARELATGS
ncbi:MAG: phosphoglucomutase/phosphomannomutase family protein [Deinococcales bacterium]|nr:phosphoglucomutase/phosphomannomutase family protein [Deinococcales bacterium]